MMDIMCTCKGNRSGQMSRLGNCHWSPFDIKNIQLISFSWDNFLELFVAYKCSLGVAALCPCSTDSSRSVYSNYLCFKNILQLFVDVIRVEYTTAYLKSL